MLHLLGLWQARLGEEHSDEIRLIQSQDEKAFGQLAVRSPGFLALLLESRIRDTTKFEGPTMLF